MANDSKTPWWEPAVEIFGQVSTWIIVPIVLALIGGKALDNHFHTKPWIFIGLSVFAFCISAYGIVQVIRKYIDEVSNNK